MVQPRRQRPVIMFKRTVNITKKTTGQEAAMGCFRPLICFKMVIPNEEE